MGWTFGWENKQALAKHLKENLTWNKETGSSKIIASCWTGNNMWLVVERVSPLAIASYAKDGKPYRFIVLYLCKRCKDCHSGVSDWGYKDLDESMGPYEVNCPLSYLDLAPLVDIGSAKEWRESVKQYWERKANNRKNAASLKVGDKFLCYGYEYWFLRRHVRGFILAENASGRIYRIPMSKVLIPAKTENAEQPN